MKNFLAGLGIGALIGVIMAPASGEETRAQLRERAEETGEAQDGEASDRDIADVVGNMSRKAIDLQQSSEVKTA